MVYKRNIVIYKYVYFNTQFVLISYNQDENCVRNECLKQMKNMSVVNTLYNISQDLHPVHSSPAIGLLFLTIYLAETVNLLGGLGCVTSVCTHTLHRAYSTSGLLRLLCTRVKATCVYFKRHTKCS